MHEMRAYEQSMRDQTAAFVAAVRRAHPEFTPPAQEEPEGRVETKVVIVTPDNVNELLAILEGEMRPPSKGLARLIIKTVATKYGFDVRAIIGSSRDARVVEARHEAMWEVRKHTDLSTTQIGDLFGKRDHSTVIYGINKHEARLRGARYIKPGRPQTGGNVGRPRKAVAQ